MKRTNYVHHSKYFYGNKVSDYGLENGYIDYATLAKSFDLVMNNDILDKTQCVLGYWEPINGSQIYYEDENGYVIDESEYDELDCEEQEKWTQYYHEIFQWFIISDSGARILQELTDEIVYYNEDLDMYLWGVTHFGTSWDYVLTGIKIDLEDGINEQQ